MGEKVKKICKIFILGLLTFAVLGVSLLSFACKEGENPSPATRDVYNHDYGALYQEDYTPQNDKAVIFIPGLMASAIYDIELEKKDGTPFCWWGYEGFGDAVISLKTGGDTAFDFYLEGYTNFLTCDADCIPVERYRIANMKDVQNFDAFGGMSYSAERFRKYFAENNIEGYDILCWQYDWRQSIKGAGAKLESFVNAMGYDKVMFVTHSMGGIVVAEFLKKAENREKVELFMPFSAPFLGSQDAVTNLFSNLSGEEGMMTVLLGMLDLDLKDFARNFASVYNLLPFPEFASLPYFAQGGSPLTLDGEALTISDFREFVFEKDWAKGTDGKLKKILQDLDSFQSAFFIENEKGEKVHVSQLVNTHYIVGRGLDTVVGVNLSSENDGGVLSVVTNQLGDGTVPSYSACVGLPLDSANVYIVDGVAHGPIANELSGGQESGLKYIKGILDSFFAK